MRRLALFRRLYLLSRRLREPLTPAGMLVAGLTVGAAVLGVDTRQNLAHALFGFGLSCLLVDALAAVLLRRRPPRLSASRLLPRFVTLGEGARYRLLIRNDGDRPLPPLRLTERLRQPWPEAGELERYPAAAGTGRFDRRVGYPAFVELLGRLRAVRVAPVTLPPLLPGQGTELAVALTPTARGVAVFERLELRLAGPLGLVESALPLALPEAGLTVLPARRTPALPPAANRRLWQPGGIALAQRVGESEEFRGLRDYRPGDPLRAIHWRSFARTGRPVVREHQEEFFSRQALLLDAAAPHLFAPAFEQAVALAAGLVAGPRESDTLLDLLFAGDRVHRLTAGRGLGERDALLRVLATVRPTPPAATAALFAALERYAGQVASAILILLAWDQPRREAVRRLLARGLQPQVLVVSATPPQEAEAPLAALLQWQAVAVAGSGR